MQEEIKRRQAYQRFQLEWMASHGHSLEELIAELDTMREDAEEGATISEIFAEWEKDIGFGGELWPCFAEFLDCEYHEAEEQEEKKPSSKHLGALLRYHDYRYILAVLSKIQDPAEKDAAVLEIWNAFADVPMDPETEKMEEAFLSFPAGTDRETIWHWFDDNYSRGVHALLYGDAD